MTIAELQHGLNISINELSPAAKNFINDACTLLTEICKVRMFQKETRAIFGKFLHDSLTTSQKKSSTTSVPKSRNPTHPDSYKIYEFMFANFGDIIYYENGQFFLSKM